ncbi:MAG: FAD-binding protein [Candidatus Raymondbacteria bacterium RifOxyA12_full_50_37]|nr:MAG: FAD-binding protein [Candidatus Raymondbacteria bacterium RifOxyB12_full_50_8]OGJ91468.1 MAG: FAD-binding protein [Candidatus Raymondbacteria bacterium RifOxyA12_full_50_37]OGJ92798.1 MAG: FAD-binding protein [Candidatus Raymondbacteria bacterium RIFOXYA2_FULL_49_16]OGJ96679.1 MAG: FAD-binding protein [Candidatus Raymondbacteria bacterium RifOxyC12_full_50_8]OGP44574.1 MAG: FAD-binding protein [Candidatus Raymondbacteria bacterium RIFOXYB2_FULL_49_35]
MKTKGSIKKRRLRYNHMTPKLAAELCKISGEKYVIYDDKEKLEPYSHDEVAETQYAHMPEALVRPGSTTEVSSIIKWANRRKVPVTPRGAGSGLSGGAVPIHGGVVMHMDRMNKVVEYDRINMTITVEPGMVTNDINDLIKGDGLFYAGYPMSLETCYIGGNVAENAGGGKAVKYGVTARYVIGLEIVTPTGDIITLGGKLVKDVTGYNVIQLMVGSEGTLGVFTKITLRLMPLPKANVDLLCLFKTPDEAIAVVPKIMTAGGIIPTAIEFMDKTSVQTTCQYLNESIPYQQAGAMLLITVDGPNAAQVEQEYEAIGELCMKNGAIEVYVADNFTTSQRIWNVRKNIAEAFKVISPHQSLEDIVVPIASIPEMVRELQVLSKKYGVSIPCYGHAGDGNLHATPVMNPAWTLKRWNDTLPNILIDLYTITSRLGGTISGEHGIGHKRKKYMPLVVSKEYLGMLRSIKKALDPNSILNPGKIFNTLA